LDEAKKRLNMKDNSKSNMFNKKKKKEQQLELEFSDFQQLKNQAAPESNNQRKSSECNLLIEESISSQDSK